MLRDGSDIYRTEERQSFHMQISRFGIIQLMMPVFLVWVLLVLMP